MFRPKVSEICGLALLLHLMGTGGCVKANRQGRLGQDQVYKTFSPLIDLSDYNNQSLFQTGDVQLIARKFNLKGEQDWKEVNHIQLWFKMCGLRDRASQGILQGEKFHVSSELGDDIIASRGPDDQTQRSNPLMVNNDCLYWSQEIPYFDYLAPSVNLVLHYKIQSLGSGLGTLIRRVAFNPWDMYRNNSKWTGLMDITFFNYDQWPKGNHWAIRGDEVLKALHGKLIPSKASLQMRKLKVMALPKEVERLEEYNRSLDRLSPEERKIRKEINSLMIQKQGYNITLNIEAQPFVWLKDSTGVPHPKDITTGKFKVFMNLVASDVTDNSKKYLLTKDIHSTTGRSTSFSWTLQENGLQASVPLLLTQDPEKGRVELLLKVVPQSPELANVKPFTAVYDLGPYNRWARNQSPQFKQQGYEPMRDIDYDQYLGSEDLKREFEGIHSLRPAERYFFNKLNIRFVRFMPGESATDRTLQYQVETCITDGFSGEILGAGYQFRIRTNDLYKGDHTVIRRTNNDGCMTWFGFLSHKYYRKEVLEKKVAHVTYVGTVEGQDMSDQVLNPYHTTFTYYMNPWDEKWTFGWDERYMPENYPEEVRKQRETAPETKLYIADCSYETMGFRYAIDHFLKLKVRKAILLKAYPYVLKYNSIRAGRLATRKLRDGIYLMKVALQKDYLAPDAKGVRLYDKGVSPDPSDDKQVWMSDQRLDYGMGAHESQPLSIMEDDKDEQGRSLLDLEKLRLYDIFNEGLKENSLPEIKGQSVESRMVVTDESTGEEKNLRLFTDSDTGEAHQLAQDEPLSGGVSREFRRQYISVQQKLVRVMNGTIVTPVEFEMEDLRLMRIRNQLFIQLQTIDEYMLRTATLVDGVFSEMIKDFNFQEKMEEIYDFLGETKDIKTEEDIQSKLDEIFHLENLSKGQTQWEQRGLSLPEARRQIYSMFGLDQFKEGTPEYESHREKIHGKILRLLQYKANELRPQAALIEEKRALTNEILSQLQNLRAIQQEDFENQIDAEFKNAYLRDPWMKFMFSASSDSLNKETLLARIMKERIGKIQAKCDLLSDSDRLKCLKNQKLHVLESLTLTDFTENPLTPNFSLDLLANDGIHNPHKNNTNNNPSDDDGRSGLPSRTFVGPLTFLFNRNGTSLRPTDILNEAVCPTAPCSVPDLIENNKIPAEVIQKTMGLDPEGSIVTDLNREIYTNSDSINKDYEQNRYYGFLRAYHNMTVDKLIEEKRKIVDRYQRSMHAGSQISNFTRSFRLKYSLLNDNKQSRFKHVNWEGCAAPPASDPRNSDSAPQASLAQVEAGACYEDRLRGPEIHTTKHFFKQLNEREYHRPEFAPDFYEKSHRHFVDAEDYYHIGPKDFTKEDVEKIISINPQEKGYDPKMVRDFSHRMCFVLTQNLLSDQFFDRPYLTPWEKRRLEKGKEVNQEAIERQTLKRNKDSLSEIELMCHRFLANVYGYPMIEGPGNSRLTRSRLDHLTSPDENLFKYSPIILERKARVYKTTGRYFYRGGKSLNMNLNAGFRISSSHGIKTVTSTGFRPWGAFQEVVGLKGISMAGLGAMGGLIAGVPGAIMGAGVGLIISITSGGLTMARQTGKDEAAGRTQDTRVNSGTFLVSQHATFDVELGEYEKCMVARFHPSFLKTIIRAKNYFLKPDFVDHPITPEHPQGDPHRSDLNSLGLFLCTGKVIDDKPLFVKEKYYYFTQHFITGDMLDMADIHNHPWLLQLRGLRDYMAFTAMIGAREVDYIDNNNWLSQVLSETWTDFKAMKFSGSRVDNKRPQFEVVNQEEGTNWPLEELSRAYFNVSPTFPGMYTFFEEKPDWPHYETYKKQPEFPNP